MNRGGAELAFVITRPSNGSARIRLAGYGLCRGAGQLIWLAGSPEFQSKAGDPLGLQPTASS